MTKTFKIAPLNDGAMRLNWLILLPMIAVLSVVFPLILSDKKVTQPWLLMAPVGLITCSVLGLLIWMIGSSRRTRFEVSPQGLQIHYPLYGRSFTRKELDLDAARMVNLEHEADLRPAWRTNGVGLVGFGAGWFRLKNKQKALIFLANHQPVVLLPTRQDFVLLLTPEHPESFLEALRHA
jgi:hypothetical protein